MKPKNNPVLHPVTKRISCVKGIHVQVSFQIGVTNSIQSAPIKRLIWRSRGPEVNNQEMRQKLWGKHISGSPTWACVRIPQGLLEQMSGPRCRVSQLVRLGGTRTPVSLTSFHVLLLLPVQGPHLGNHDSSFPLTLHPPHLHSSHPVVVQRTSFSQPFAWQDIYFPGSPQATIDLSMPSPPHCPINQLFMSSNNLNNGFHLRPSSDIGRHFFKGIKLLRSP